jgi:hypothetical protein
MQEYDARRLIALETENAELKKLLEQAQREKTALESVLSKNGAPQM